MRQSDRILAVCAIEGRLTSPWDRIPDVAACGAGCDALGATGEFLMQTASRNLRATCGLRVLPFYA